MASPPAAERTVERERPSHLEPQAVGLWGWFLFSGFLHGAIIWSFFLIPHAPVRKPIPYPVYTVDLVGGERLGGEILSSGVTAAPEPRKEAKKTQPEPPPRAQEVKKEKKEKRKAAERTAKIPEKVAVKGSKTEVKKEERKEEGLSGEVREKLIQAALERVKERAATEQKKEAGASASTGPGEGPGASAPGQGGSGGGIVKGIEFLVYRNRIHNLIRERWTWVGKRSALEVIVRFSVQESGEITGLKIVQRSGDPSYDDSVIRALKRASPLPPPPESYRKDFMDVEYTFRPEDLGG